MSDDFELPIDVLKFLVEIRGRTNDVVIDCNVNKHDEDMIIIRGTTEKPIDAEEVLEAYQEMQRKLERYNEERSYYYEGMMYNEKSGMYEIGGFLKNTTKWYFFF